MNICVICGKSFEPPKNYTGKHTCSKECFKSYMKKIKPTKEFLQTSFKKGHIPFNKGVPQKEWMSKENIEICKKTYIQNQNCKSVFSLFEDRYLPHNTNCKGTITRRKHIHTKGKNKGKVEYEYFINIDWKGNRKPNNLYRRYVWEYCHKQDVPKGYVVYSVDGNPENFDSSNLIIITRRELLRLNSGK